ncbi:MAG: GNAT family N-acetyltransferase [Clostridiales Family XIII bacterium]|nr:GNAT family N-acetyltransferase [Clostridiales Family XIII bacterium]
MRELPKITVTDDYESLVEFFIENELEFSVNDDVPQDLIKCWQVRLEEADPETERRSACGKPDEVDGRRSACGKPDEVDKGRGACGKLVGACVLALREGEYIIDGIAVDAELRRVRLGEALLRTAIEEVGTLGGKSLFLVARAPGFFRKQGFVTVARDEAPNFFECFGCPQYNSSCFPEVMKRNI